MAEITAATTLQELAVIVSEALEQAGILATLSGGALGFVRSDIELPQQHSLTPKML